MVILIKESIKLYSYVIDEISDPRTSAWPLMSSPFCVIAILTVYVYFVKNIGPKLMENRPPFNLDRIIQVYNIIQVMLALYLVERSLTLGWSRWSAKPYKWLCQPVDYTNNPIAVETARSCYLYFLVKILDLSDTVFFVLRKNNRQITFLHVYHHAGMVAGTWWGTKYIPGGHGTFLGLINSVVHAVMYFYYFLTSVSPGYKKNIWWKKNITQMQMIQFLALTVHSLPLLFMKDCPFGSWFPLVLVPQNTIMFILFYNFYQKAYCSNNKMATAETNGKLDSHRNGNEKKMT